MLFALLWLFSSEVSLELKYIVLFLFTLGVIISKRTIYSSLIYVITPLLGLFFIALFSSLFYHPTAYDFIKDCIHITKPILTICLGFYLVHFFSNKVWVIKTLVYFCFFSAVVHILTLLIGFEGEWNTVTIRMVGGKGSDYEAFVFSFFWVYLRKKGSKVFSRKFKRWFLLLTIISIALYLSRTTFIAMIFFLVTFYGFTKVTRKQIIYLIGVFVLAVSFIVSLQFMDIRRDSTGFESFLYKIKIAPTEIFDADINTKDHTQLWDNWRAYEVKKAIETMSDKNSTMPFITGVGLGALVDLGFEAPLGKERMQYIPHIHNGYGYVFFKTGTLGLILLLIWIFYVYGYIYKDTVNKEKAIFHKTVSALGLYLLFSTLVITGIFNLGMMVAFLLGITMGLSTINNPILYLDK